MKKIYKIIMGFLCSLIVALVAMCGIVVVYSLTDHDIKSKSVTVTADVSENEEKEGAVSSSYESKTNEAVALTDVEIPIEDNNIEDNNIEDNNIEVENIDQSETENETQGNFVSSSNISTFFLNNIVGLTQDEVVSGMGEPTRLNDTYGTTLFYDNIEEFGMYGNITIEMSNGVVDTAYWEITNINVEDYSEEITQIRDYYNQMYFQVDTNDWRQDKTEIGLVGIIAGNYIRLLYE